MRNAVIGEASVGDATEIVERLIAFNSEQAEPENVAHVALSLKTHDGRLIGGVTAARSWKTLIIDVLWVDEIERGKGYGEQLLAAVEQRGVELGCNQAALETFSFQATRFYVSNGYTTVGEVMGWPPSGKLSRMVKPL